MVQHFISLFLQIKNEQYSRFTLQPTEDGEGHAEIKLSDEFSEADGQVGGSPNYRPRPRCQNRCTLCVFVVGMLLIFATGRIIIVMRNVVYMDTEAPSCLLHHNLGPPGCMVGYFSQHKPQAELVGCELGAKMTTAAAMTAAAMATTTKKTPEVNPAAVPSELGWMDIIQLLKQKLTTQSFTQTLR